MARHGGTVEEGLVERWYCEQCGYLLDVRGHVPFTLHLSLNDVSGRYDFSSGTIERTAIHDPACSGCGGPVVFRTIHCIDHDFADYLDTRDRATRYAIRYCRVCDFVAKRVRVDASAILNHLGEGGGTPSATGLA